MVTPSAERTEHFLTGLMRAFAGAVIFGLPLLMTMEMWWLGFYIPAWKLALLLALFFPFLVALSWHVGFEATFSLRDDVLDALVAYAVAFVAAALVLAMLGLLTPQMSVREIVGKVSLQAVPASIGALLSQTQLGHHAGAREPRGGVARYGSELFLMVVGALFLAFSMAPTEEIPIIAAGLSSAATIVMMLVSLLLMHGFMYGVAFRGSPQDAERASPWSVLLRFTVVGYALTLLVSAFMLWIFGRVDGLDAVSALQAVVVLAFPAAVGAAAARLIL